MVSIAEPVVDGEYLKEINKARQDLHALIYNKQCAPLMLRLAWHDAATFDSHFRTGGANGSIRNHDVYNRESNKGLKIAIDYCEEVKSNLQKITYADLYQLAGVVAVEITGGPTIEFVPGRKDSSISPEEGTFPPPNGGVKDLWDLCYRMGLSDRQIVALSGTHTLGQTHADRSGFDGPWTSEPLKFDNSYFVELFKGESSGLLKLPTDLALLENSTFRDYAKMYAEDEDLFFKDYTAAHKRFSELVFPRRTIRYLDVEDNNSSLLYTAIDVAFVVAAMAVGYKYRVHIWQKMMRREK